LLLQNLQRKSFFGNEDPINKVVKIDNELNYKVSAVVADPPDNSTFKFDFIAPFDYSSEYIKNRMKEWTNSSHKVFVQTIPGANMAAVDKYIDQVKHQHDANDKISTYFTFP
jgi:putative ABC transport system permease protein